MTGIMTPMAMVDGKLPGSAHSVFGDGGWQHRLAQIAEMMREMSQQDDPQSMVRTYGARVRKLMPSDRWISLSRRGLEPPWYRITRSSTWSERSIPGRRRTSCRSSRGGSWAS